MRRLSTLLFLTVSIFTIAWGQAENDLCANAIPVQLGPVLNCPNDTPTETLVAGSTIDATSTQPAIRLSDFDQNLSFIAQSADVWYTFTAIASQTTISISGGLEHPVLIL
ncbi:MAG: hypothetical protein HRU12_24420, partial [Phaeodactylibacter sp.]|nr:hypothetical protein [Phaeodactylibacter sp.]